jgi:hypothetical protein
MMLTLRTDIAISSPNAPGDYTGFAEPGK